MIDIQQQQDLGRAMNALQDFLIHKLLIPKIYLNSNWIGNQVDVMAIDRAGSGDVHIIEVFRADYSNEAYLWKLRDLVRALRSVECQYRYVAVVNDQPAVRTISPEESTVRDSFAEDGVGRVGVLFVDLCEVDPKLQVRVVIRAERFRSSKKIVELTDQFMATNTPNWEIRE